MDLFALSQISFSKYLTRIISTLLFTTRYFMLCSFDNIKEAYRFIYSYIINRLLEFTVKFRYFQRLHTCFFSVVQFMKYITILVTCVIFIIFLNELLKF